MNLKDLEKFLCEIPYNDKNVIPIQVVGEEFIITKMGNNSYIYELNRFLPHNSIRTKKIEFKLEDFQEIYKSCDKIKNKELWKTTIYVGFISFIWAYFLITNIQMILLLFTIGFGNVPINLFLMWLYLLSLIGWIYSLIENIGKPFIKHRRIPTGFFNPSDIILKKNELNAFFLFSSQLVYFFTIYILYFPYTPLTIIDPLLLNFFIFLTIGSGISIHYLWIFLRQLQYNFKIKNNTLPFLYALAQDLTYQNENYYIITKMINDIEKSKLISFGVIPKIVGIITFFLATIPNIIYTA